jgi:hypothetical protein
VAVAGQFSKAEQSFNISFVRKNFIIQMAYRLPLPGEVNGLEERARNVVHDRNVVIISQISIIRSSVHREIDKHSTARQMKI